MEVKNIKLLNYLYEIWTWSRTTCVPFPFSETMTMLCTVKYMAQLHYQYSTWELMLTFIQKLYLPFVDVPLWIVSLSFMMFMMFAMFYESVISWSWISCDSQFSINLKCDVLSFNAHGFLLCVISSYYVHWRLALKSLLVCFYILNKICISIPSMNTCLHVLFCMWTIAYNNTNFFLEITCLCY